MWQDNCELYFSYLIMWPENYALFFSYLIIWQDNYALYFSYPIMSQGNCELYFPTRLCDNSNTHYIFPNWLYNKTLTNYIFPTWLYEKTIRRQWNPTKSDGLVQSGYRYRLIECTLFSPWYGWTIPHLALSNNHSFTLVNNDRFTWPWPHLQGWLNVLNVHLFFVIR
jgi:hypothetical protein